MAPVVVYRSSDLDVLAAVDKHNEEYEAWRTRVAALPAELGAEGRSVIVNDDYRRIVLGFDAGPKEPPPRGWRTTQRGGRWVLVPDKRLKDGRAAYELIQACGPSPDPRDALAGMPRDHLGPGQQGGVSLYRPVPLLLDGTVWVTWGCKVPVEEVDLGVWELARLSEFYAAVEAQEDGEVTG